MRYLFFILIIALTLLSACSKDRDEVNIIVSLEHVVGNMPLEFDEFLYTNAFGNTYSVITLKYFISDLIFEMENGQEVLFDLAHYCDATDPATLTFEAPVELPIGNYVRFSFIFGLNEEKNTIGSFPDPPENYMEWPIPLGGGYHYMKLEGKVENGESTNNYQAHSGPTDGNPYYITVSFDQAFAINSNTNKLVLLMDINKWWVHPHELDLNTIQSVMGNPDVQLQFRDNGADVFSLSVQ